MIELGYYCLVAACLLSLYGVVAASLGGRFGHDPLVRSAENGMVSVFGLFSASSGALIYLLLKNRFEVEYVAGYTARNIPWVYKVTAFWGGQSGSLLLWALVLSFFTLVVVLQNRSRNRALMPYTTAVLAGILGFFSLLLVFATNPFDTLPVVPPDGRGLNPLLQNSYMAIHPPILYHGLIGLSVPFAFAMGALISGRLDTSWVRTTRRWTIVSWALLTFGITLGGMWAYEELGWGGYWAWDPVENASFMPWLVATAFLHSIMITEKKGMLKIWNFVLILMAFELTIFGTFITRSGAVSSVHSFALSNVGPMFVVFLALSTFFGLACIVFRADELKSEHQMQSFLSREASFLLNNLLFICICFAIFWGTVYPMISEAFTGEKVGLKAPFFNQVNRPLALGLLLLTGICPLIAWRKASARNFRRNFLYPAAGGLVTGLAGLAAGLREIWPLLFFSGAGFVFMTLFFEFYKGAKARQTIRPSRFVQALADLTLMNKRRYGGFIIHGGVVLVFIGIIASSYFQREVEFSLSKGDRVTVGRYDLEFSDFKVRRDPEKDVYRAELKLSSGGNSLGSMLPEKHFHHNGNPDNLRDVQPMTEVAIRSTVREDLYVILHSWTDTGDSLTFRIYLNPLVQLIWIGIGVMVCGGIFVLFPNRMPPVAKSLRREKRATQAEAA